MKLAAHLDFLELQDLQKIDQNLADIAYDEDHSDTEQRPASAPWPLQPDLLEYSLIVLVQDEDWQDYPQQKIKASFV